MLCLAILLLTIPGALQGTVVIDRVAIAMGKQVIKLSDIKRDLLLTQFMNREPSHVSPDALRKSAERLIDQMIIRNEIVRGGYSRPGDAEANDLMAQLRRDRFGSSDSTLREELSRYGLSETELRDQLLWQLAVLRFIDQRFRPGVLVSDEEVRAYYNDHRADLKRSYPQKDSFEALEPMIRTSLEGERINRNFVEWLEEARKRNRIEYRQEAFQ
jgi:hypothetical protein